ncbi:MAG: cell division protein FtsQ/DivIB [Burkholderiaceae bacterium]|jgi:cell division protein FtsQ
MGSLWQDSRLMNVMAGLFSIMSLVLLMVAALAWLTSRPMFDVRCVRLEGGMAHVTAAGIRLNAVPLLRGNFFTMDLHAARAAFEAVPWVRKASVRRIWPNQLSVRLEEHEPVAQWGESALINGYGEAFVVNLAEVDAELPLLHGPAGSQQIVLKRFVDLKRWLARINLKPVALRLSDRFAWSATLAGGLRLELGREQTSATLQERVGLFVKSYTVVTAQLMKSVQVVDLRYPNGFSLKGEPLRAVLTVKNDEQRI